jgi:putative NADH-flavin reductase
LNLTIFGATGKTGKHLLAQALAAGHHVTALVRDSSKLRMSHDRLRIVQGDAQNAVVVNEAVTGAEAVLSVLGPTSNEPILAVSKGTDTILAAMKSHNVRRLIISSGAGVREPNDSPGLFDTLIGALVKTVSRNVYEDMAGTVATVRASDLDWTIVRVPMLTDSPGTGNIKVGYVGKGIGVHVSRTDLAGFMLKQLQDTTYIQKAPAISN